MSTTSADAGRNHWPGADQAPPLEEGLARFLSEQWGGTAKVLSTATASAGARRRNVLFDAQDASGKVHQLVATIIPTEGMQIMSIHVEAGAIAMAEAGGVPVAHMHGASDDPNYVGGAFFITSRVDGETVPRRVLRLVEAENIGEKVAFQIGQAFAKLHAIPLDRIPDGLLEANAARSAAATTTIDPSKPPAAQVLAGMRAQYDELLQPSPVFALGLRWLEDHLPNEQVPVTVVHRDTRTGNIIVSSEGLRALLDWEVCGVGDPMEDLAWMCVRMWRFGNDDREVGGMAGRQPMIDVYREAGGTYDEGRFLWWLTAGTLRWGIGLANQAASHLDHSFRSIVMAGSGRRVCEQELDVLSLLAEHFAPGSPPLLKLSR